MSQTSLGFQGAVALVRVLPVEARPCNWGVPTSQQPTKNFLCITDHEGMLKIQDVSISTAALGRSLSRRQVLRRQVGSVNDTVLVARSLWQLI